MSEPLGVDAQENEPGVTPGALLRRERERRALSVQQTAEDLHLDPWVIEAIEANRFQVLGAPVYAKGHLRKYAARLGLSVEDVIARYEALQDRPVETDPIPTAVAAPVPQLRGSSKFPVRTALVLVAIAAVAWLAIETFPVISGFLQARPAAEEPATSTPVSSAVVAPSPSPELAAAESEQHVANLPEANSEALASPSTAPATPADSEPAPVAPLDGAISLRLAFSGESWTEVTDAEGERLMFAMGTPGHVRTLSGIPPLQVTLGVASAVSVQVNGRQVLVPEREGRESSRFVIGPDGNLQ